MEPSTLDLIIFINPDLQFLAVQWESLINHLLSESKMEHLWLSVAVLFITRLGNWIQIILLYSVNSFSSRSNHNIDSAFQWWNLKIYACNESSVHLNKWLLGCYHIYCKPINTGLRQQSKGDKRCDNNDNLSNYYFNQAGSVTVMTETIIS